MEKTEEKITPKHIDIDFYVSKFGIPLLERKRLIIIFFLGGVVISLLLSSFIRPQFISEAAIQIEQPATALSSSRRESVIPRKARAEYVLAVEERLKSNSFAIDVLKILPDEVKEDLKAPVDVAPQIIGGLKGLAKKLIGVKREKLAEETDATSVASERRALLQELEKRVGIRVSARTAMIWITGATLDKNLAPILVKSYLDVLMALNLEENKEGIRGKIDFALKQKGHALRALQKAEEELVAFREKYEIPAQLKVTPDTKLQLQLDMLRANFETAKERYERLEWIYLEEGIKEAGVVVNIKVLNSPMIPLRPTKSAKQRILLFGILGGLAAGLGLTLLMDNLKGPIRYKTDIIDTVNLPILGNVPGM